MDNFFFSYFHTDPLNSQNLTFWQVPQPVPEPPSLAPTLPHPALIFRVRTVTEQSLWLTIALRESWFRNNKHCIFTWLQIDWLDFLTKRSVKLTCVSLQEWMQQQSRELLQGCQATSTTLWLRLPVPHLECPGWPLGSHQGLLLKWPETSPILMWSVQFNL